jgi:hypothetical protein
MTRPDHGDPQACRRQSAGKPQVLPSQLIPIVTVPFRIGKVSRVTWPHVITLVQDRSRQVSVRSVTDTSDYPPTISCVSH